MKNTAACLSQQQEKAHYEQNKESNLRYIRAKLPSATAEQLGIIAAFIKGLGVIGWSDNEFNRNE